MFETLGDRLQNALHKIKGYGKITEDNISDMMREIRLALLEADVNYKVVKEFTNIVKEKALGEEELPGIIYPLGTIKMSAEAIGEAERYRALFTNFGIPHPEEYMNVFADTDLNEALVDKIAMNKNSKRMFLSYNEIFPYVGTYKALANAVNVLGYADIFFKEWYKETGKATNNNVIFDIAYNSSNVVNTINAVSLDERVSLKKLNWLSMVYKINEELLSSAFDQYAFLFH